MMRALLFPGALILCAQMAPPAIAEPSTCWNSRKLAVDGKMKAYDCDVSMVGGPDPHFIINGKIRVYPDFDNESGTIVHMGNRYKVLVDLEDDLAIWIGFGNAKEDEMVFDPPQAFKASLRRQINANTQQRPSPTSRYADTIERTLFD